MNRTIIGRKKELVLLNKLARSIDPEFLVIWGRRRVGKTFLLEQFFTKQKCLFFQVTGLRDGTFHDQLEIFRKALIETFFPGMLIKNFSNWMEALDQLTVGIEKLPKNKRVVLLFDELPWLATQKSKLLPSIDHYWNTKWSKREGLLFIACGSAASWMLKKIIYAKGGLHNRITSKISLKPLSLSEAKQQLVAQGFSRSNEQVLQIYLAFGGIPYYLKQVDASLSAIQNINQLCFNQDGLLFDEFDKLFASLFDHSEIYEGLIRIIAKYNQGISRDDILKKIKFLSRGGWLSTKLKELEEAGFIVSFVPYGKSRRDTFYKVIDEYVLFYLTWIEPVKQKLKNIREQANYWPNIAQNQQYKVWQGYAFEALCYKHIDEIIQTLGIENIAMGASSWRYISKRASKEQGVQIDLLIDRSDGVINVCEIKCNSTPFSITKEYAESLKRKLAVFKCRSKVKQDLLLTFITLNGLKNNKYKEQLVRASITWQDLFK